ncbi:Sec-independent protein translocase subunit TatA [Rhodococcus rhodnii]|uniref:Sec-independent protein translocase protein TatA n=3 Tax=Rhodococcus rhodnii TaxID=38312 RepID=R7WW56_9NOCA|nr:Sec-independent protein translocase protein [Rhodococcus rhodnii LMG 5362]TXG91197.1 Sec-independent protein translocase subunit TatA [Rhodococcus rhodnii]
MSPWHWAVVILVLVIFFGSKKLPDAARGLGRSLRIFKSEVKEMTNDDSSSHDKTDSARPAPAPQSEITERPAPAPVSEADRAEHRSA